MNDIHVILVDSNDNELGTIEKMEAHRKSLLHRAISVFLLTPNGDWILQQRAYTKYHSKLLWTNSCCTHPLPNETNIDAAKRRIKEEMGIILKSELTELFSFIYKEKLDNELSEHEFDHVFMGITNEKPNPDPLEVNEWKTIAYNDLLQDVQQNPENYTVWFRKIFEKVNNCIINKSKTHTYFNAGFLE